MAIGKDAFIKKEAQCLVLPSGDRVELRTVSMRDERVCERHHPKPTPPKVHAPRSGSKAPKIVDREDPGYLDAFSDWFDEHELLKLAMAIDYQPEGSVAFTKLIGEQITPWIAATLNELSGVLSPAWIAKANSQIETASLAELIDEAGLGNSLTPPQ